MSPEVARSPPEDWLYSKGSIKLAKHAHAPVTKPDETATSARAHQTDRRHVGGLALRLPIHGWVCVSQAPPYEPQTTHTGGCSREPRLAGLEMYKLPIKVCCP